MDAFQEATEQFGKRHAIGTTTPQDAYRCFENTLYVYEDTHSVDAACAACEHEHPSDAYDAILERIESKYTKQQLHTCAAAVR